MKFKIFIFLMLCSAMMFAVPPEVVHDPEPITTEMMLTADAPAPTSFQYGVVQVADHPDPVEVIEGIKASESWGDILSWETAIYTLLIILGGYVSAFIPGFRTIEDGTWRVLTFSVMVVGGGLVLGFGNIWMGAFSYFFSTSLYEVVLKWFKKSPKPQRA